MTAPIYRCWTKATDAEAGPPRYSGNWAVARRDWFRIYADRVECGDWRIEGSDVEEAVLFSARQMLIPVLVLSIRTATKTYQFGFNPWARVADYLPFRFRRERAQLGYSAFSVALRVFLVAYLLYWAWRRLF
ncbi:MAG: hypothetical protein U0271_28705 [Polyangiaceae bacterium]